MVSTLDLGEKIFQTYNELFDNLELKSMPESKNQRNKIFSNR